LSPPSRRQPAGDQPTAEARGTAGRPLRADAQRNRARVLEVAIEAFAKDGLAVPIQEIARRAEVGTGTVSRHFPTKEALYEAIVFRRAEWLVDQARSVAETNDPGPAFFDFFSIMVQQSAIDRGLADALSGAGFDVEAAASRSEHDVVGALRSLLTQAQQAGAVRGDVDVADIKALIVGCTAREREATDSEARDRMIAVVAEGLRARH
jgi:AcrR family transcriptional regulator